MSSPVKISGVIITFNEERNIADCILSMKDVIDELVVVDSFSMDDTVAICEELGARVIKNPFEGHIEQKNFAMGQAKHDIILSLDADERLSDKLRESILTAKNNWNASGYRNNRLNNYCGKWLKHCWYPDRQLRLWDRRMGSWGGTNPHDRVIIKEGEVKKLEGDLLHFAYYTIEEHKNQIEKFAHIAARAKKENGSKVFLIWHVVLNPIYRFISTYFLKLGILDGYYGWIYSKNAARLNFLKYWYLYKLKTGK